MLNGQRKFWLFAAAILFLLALASLLTPFYAEICEKEYAGQKDCAAYHIAVFLILYIGQTLEAHSGAIIGIATVALAIITWRVVTLGREQSETTRAQLRAYLSVVIGGAAYQEREKQVKFSGNPSILNNGQTPAYNVRYRIKSDIFTDSVALGYVFTEPPDVPKSQASIGPREQRIMSAPLDHYVTDSEIQDILDAKGKALYVWGVIHYDDAFGRPHYTQFAQKLWWLPDRSNVWGAYDGRFGLSD